MVVSMPQYKPNRISADISKKVRILLWLHRMLWIGRSKFSTASLVCFIVCYGFAVTNYSIFFDVAGALLAVAVHLSLTFFLENVSNRKLIIEAMIGIRTGPLFLLANLNRRLRRSQAWGYMSLGGCVGVSAWSIFLWFGVLRIHGKVLMPISIWSYFTTRILRHVIRSTADDRRTWKFFLFGFLLGFIFGSFSTFFRHCFPDAKKHTARESSLYNGMLVGLVPMFIFLFFYGSLSRSFHW